jgi:hypothetical protein
MEAGLKETCLRDISILLWIGMDLTGNSLASDGLFPDSTIWQNKIALKDIRV